VLGVPPGTDGRGRIIASLLPIDEVARDPHLNFVTSQAGQYADVRVEEVLRSGGTLQEDRLRRNMLSSMPLCFNIFGSLRDEPKLAHVVSKVFGIAAAEVVRVECEWAPDKRSHLNDRTAFDAFIEYRDAAGHRRFLGIETKYTEPFSPKEYDSDLYQRVTSTSGYFVQGAGDRLVGRATNQMWRMAMLAVAILNHQEYDAGGVAVLSLADDRHAAAAVEGVRADVVDPSLVSFVALEDLVDEAAAVPELAEWGAAFSTRYLDLTPVLS
jgi:PD-(D/E)XK nuclease superfamily protein